MTAEQVRALSVADKLMVMEVIWDDMRERLRDADLPAEIKDLLDRRRQRVKDGVSGLRDWDEVKTRIGRG